MIKGCKVKEAELSNAIDIYALLKDAIKEGIYPEGEAPTDKELQHYYMAGLLPELKSPYHKYWIAQTLARFYICVQVPCLQG